MIRCEALTRTFGDLRAVDGVDLSVPDGSIVALLGPNGAGKTTTVRMLAGLIGITSGRALNGDVDVAAHPELARARSGLLMGDAGVYDQMTMTDYLAFFGEAYGITPRAAKARAAALADEVGLADRARDKLGSFSKGMRQRVALARALVNDPPVLFLDEPTSGLDVEAAIEFRARIKAFRDERRSIVLCTHILEEAEQLADEIVVIQQGAIVGRGSPDELKRTSGGRRFTVELTGDAAAYVAAIGRIALTDVHAEDGSLSFTTEDPHETNPAVVRALVRARAQIVSIVEHERSLEQAYVDIVRGTDDR